MVPVWYGAVAPLLWYGTYPIWWYGTTYVCTIQKACFYPDDVWTEPVFTVNTHRPTAVQVFLVRSDKFPMVYHTQASIPRHLKIREQVPKEIVIAQANGRVSGKVIQTGPDRHIDFAFYDRVWVHHIGNTQGDQVRRLGRWLGVAHRVGSRLCH